MKEPSPNGHCACVRVSVRVFACLVALWGLLSLSLVPWFLSVFACNRLGNCVSELFFGMPRSSLDDTRSPTARDCFVFIASQSYLLQFRSCSANDFFFTLPPPPPSPPFRLFSVLQHISRFLFTSSHLVHRPLGHQCFMVCRRLVSSPLSLFFLLDTSLMYVCFTYEPVVPSTAFLFPLPIPVPVTAKL